MNVITIGREFGSGGRELGKRLAETLGYAYYDEEILTAIAERSGFAEEYIKGIVEGETPRAYPITYGRTFGAVGAFNENHLKVVQAQEGVLRELAQKKNCVIVGRCADIILKDMNPLNLFVYADMETKIKRCQFKAAADEKLSDKDMKRLIQKTERQRRYYYETITDQKWGDKANYHLCINTTGPKVNGKEIKVQIPAIAAFCRAWFEA